MPCETLDSFPAKILIQLVLTHNTIHIQLVLTHNTIQIFCFFSSFRREAYENCAVLGYYAASSGN